LSAYHEPHLHPSASTANQPTTDPRLPPTLPPPSATTCHCIASHLHFALKATPFFFCAIPLKKNYKRTSSLLWPIEQHHRNLFALSTHGRGFQVRDPLQATDLSPEKPEEQRRSNIFAPRA
jgi:hypothetical protein